MVVFPIKTLLKRRRSFVMHITPQDMPIKHMDYFFDKKKKIPAIKRKYEAYNGRLIERGSTVDFMHKKTFHINDLGIF